MEEFNKELHRMFIEGDHWDINCPNVVVLALNFDKNDDHNLISSMVVFKHLPDCTELSEVKLNLGELSAYYSRIEDMVERFYVIDETGLELDLKHCVVPIGNAKDKYKVMELKFDYKKCRLIPTESSKTGIFSRIKKVFNKRS